MSFNFYNIQNNIQNTTVLPWNQNFIPISSSLNASSQLTIRKNGNNGLLGQKLYQLSTVKVLVFSSNGNSLDPLFGTTTLTSFSMNSSNQSNQSMTITSPTYYVSATVTGSVAIPLPVKQFQTQISFSGGEITWTNFGGSIQMTLVITDPSTCSTATTVPPNNTAFYTSRTLLTPISFITVSSLVFSDAGTITVTSATVSPTLVSNQQAILVTITFSTTVATGQSSLTDLSLDVTSYNR
jgi:hypothetical protein